MTTIPESQKTKIIIPKGVHIFILEDLWQRYSSLKKQTQGKVTITWVKDNHEAIKKFEKEKNKIGMMLIDHDLGETKYSQDDSTREFVEWLAKNHKGFKVPTIIHSLNPRGALYLKYVLQQANYPKVYQVPFEYIKFSIEE